MKRRLPMSDERKLAYSFLGMAVINAVVAIAAGSVELVAELLAIIQGGAFLTAGVYILKEYD